jgi:hypothetical protein
LGCDNTSSTLAEILNNREATGKIARWAIELSMYDTVYKPMTVINAQDLSDFMAEWIETWTPPMERELEYWTINFDGFLQLQGAGILESFQHLTMQSSMKHYFMV